MGTGGKGGGRRKSQEFRDLCQKFEGRKEEDVRKVARVESGRDQNFIFANVAGTLLDQVWGGGPRESYSSK